jgi:hypothetical protein
VQNTTTRTCWGATSTDANPCPTLGQTCTTTGIGVDNACYLEVSKRVGPTPSDRWRVTRGTLDSRNRSSFWYQDASAVIPGSKNTYDIALQPTEHIFEAGHRIGIVVAGNIYGAGASGSIPSGLGPAQPITIDTRLSKVSLPIVGGTAAMADAGAFVDPTSPVGGTVPPTLSLTLGTPASFGSFIPGVGQTYTASSTGSVTSTAGEATLSVADASSQNTGHLVNGTFALPQPLQARANGGTLANVGSAAAPLNLLSYSGPVSNGAVTFGFSQRINNTDALRTGAYSKTLTFTLSTTQP